MATDDKTLQLKRLLRTGKTKGYVLYDDIDALLPAGYEGGVELDEILSELARNSIEVLEEARAHRANKFKEDDEFFDENGPLEIYLREVRSTPHLTSEEEIELHDGRNRSRIRVRIGGQIWQVMTDTACWTR